MNKYIDCRNIVSFILKNDKENVIEPLIIPSELTGGLGLCNPSLLYHGGKLRMILRNVEYTLYMCDFDRRFHSRYEGSLAYYHRDDDLKLRTNNFYCELDKDTLKISKHEKIDTSKCHKEPIWTFIGLEDARLVYWGGKYYGCGVRRDTYTNGSGRMELSEMELSDIATEINRSYIEGPDKREYVEKNWMPIYDKPFHFIRWSIPNTQVVKVDIEKRDSEIIVDVDNSYIKTKYEVRGGSGLVRWDDHYIAFVHECKLERKNGVEHKQAVYVHRIVVWDTSFNIIKITKPFSFMATDIEFCIGLEKIESMFYVAFGYQDNCAYILKYTENTMNELLHNLDEDF